MNVGACSIYCFGICVRPYFFSMSVLFEKYLVSSICCPVYNMEHFQCPRAAQNKAETKLKEIEKKDTPGDPPPIKKPKLEGAGISGALAQMLAAAKAAKPDQEQ